MIFTHNSYRDWLESELTNRTQDNPRYSGSAFAKKLGLSQAYFSLLVSGRRRLTEKSAEQIAGRLGLNENESQYLMAMVQKEKYRDSNLQEFFSSKLQQLKNKINVTALGLDLFHFMSDWHYSAILELLMIEDFSATRANIAARLDLDDATVDEALGRLQDMKFIKEQDGIFVRLNPNFLNTPTEILSKALQKFHKQILRKAIAAVDDQDVNERSITGITMAIDPAKLPEAKERIQKFSQELLEFLGSGEKKEVYQLGVQLFRLEPLPTKPNLKKKDV